MIETTTGEPAAADIYVIPVHADRVIPEGIGDAPDLTALASVLDARDFSGKQGQTLFVQTPGGPTAEVLLVGLGEEASAESLRRAAAVAVRAVKGYASVATALHDVGIDGAATAVIVGTMLGAYTFDEYKSDPKPSKVASFILVGGDVTD
ncbi:MAG: M17 family peptidase N-terminal domain-containing protein, partial [Actinomycetota bacterium]